MTMTTTTTSLTALVCSFHYMFKHCYLPTLGHWTFRAVTVPVKLLNVEGTAQAGSCVARSFYIFEDVHL